MLDDIADFIVDLLPLLVGAIIVAVALSCGVDFFNFITTVN